MRLTSLVTSLLAVLGLTLAGAGPVGATAAGARADSTPGPTFHNAVSDSFSDTFADPSVIEGKDGWWYAYATADPLQSGEAPGIIHIARTHDWASWEYLGTVFTDANRPSWAEPGAGLWAPDIRYVQGQYVLYFTVTDTRLNPGGDSAIGVATAPTPSGPWTATSAPVVAPRKVSDNNYLWTFDPAGFTDADGQRYLYYGSYYGGLWVTKVSADGLAATGTASQVAIDNRYEGAYVVRHDGWYYLMGSSANCCAGPTTGYSVFAGRARSPLGPFVDAEGTPLMASRVGGTTVVTQNGNRFVGTGHHAFLTDAQGRDFIAYHAIDRNHPWLGQPFGINRRPMLLDRVDWVDGWPRARAGAGPSDSPQPAPVSTSLLGNDPANPGPAFAGGEPGPADPQSGATMRVHGSAHSHADAPGGPLEVRLDVKADRQVTLSVGQDSKVKATYDPRARTLTLRGGGEGADASTSVPELTGWRTLRLEVRDGSVYAALSASDLNDPAAEVRLDERGPTLVPGPVKLTSPDALVDNLTVQRLASDAPALVPVPQPGALLSSEEFTTGTGSMSWVRPDPAAHVQDGKLVWPVQSGDLVGSGNTGSVLLSQTPGDGDWVAETKVHLDLGVNTVRNYQQAGMIAYENDDDFARLGTVAIWNTRQTEFGRETAAAPDGRTSYGGAPIGTAAPTLWMRVAHHRNAAGEHVYRAATSRDGTTWTWGAAWVLGPSTHARIGLYTGGGAAPAVDASFDYLRFYASTWPRDPGQG